MRHLLENVSFPAGRSIVPEQKPTERGTGKQLRKWMEWSASIFAQQNEMITSTGTIKKLSEE